MFKYANKSTSKEQKDSCDISHSYIFKANQINVYDECVVTWLYIGVSVFQITIIEFGLSTQEGGFLSLQMPVFHWLPFTWKIYFPKLFDKYPAVRLDFVMYKHASHGDIHA